MPQGKRVLVQNSKVMIYNPVLFDTPHLKAEEWRFLRPDEYVDLGYDAPTEDDLKDVSALNIIDISLVSTIPDGEKQMLADFMQEYDLGLLDVRKSFKEMKKKVIDIVIDQNKHTRNKYKDLSWMPKGFSTMTKAQLKAFCKDNGIEELINFDENKNVLLEMITGAMTEKMD